MADIIAVNDPDPDPVSNKEGGSKMGNMLGALFGSKKFLGMAIALVLECLIACDVLAVDPGMKETLMQMVGVIGGGYTVGQGIADHGKEAAKITKGA